MDYVKSMALFCKQRLVYYWQLTRFDKPIGILLLLWPTLSALWLASNGTPSLPLLIIFILGTLFMRAAGCAINDFADHAIDSHVARTKNRVLAQDKISRQEALGVAITLAAFASSLLILLNGLTQCLALIAGAIAMSYPYSKRFFILPQAYLGIAFGMGILMAYSATQNQLPSTAWIFFIANIFWTIAYDTEYALVDKADDMTLNIYTSAITFGRFDVLAIMLCYCTYLGLMIITGYLLDLGKSFLLSILICACLVGYHYWLVRKRIPKRCFRAFMHNNWIGCTIFLGIVLDFALK